jgi:hypothetical protein
MAYTYAINSVLALIQELVQMDFTTQGEVPRSLPFLFAADQYSVNASDLPATTIEAGDVKIERPDASSCEFCGRVTIHHYRKRVAGANAEITAISRLAHLSATIENDPKLSWLSPTMAIHWARPISITTNGDGSMNKAAQNITVACASLLVDVNWTEYLHL